MLQIRPGDLTHDAIRWWELAGHDSEDLAKAWAIAHHAARIPALVGSAWASPRGDGTHATLTWMAGQGLLDGIFVSEPVAGARPMRGVLRLWNYDLFLVEETGVPIDQITLPGRSLEDARAWMIDTTKEHAGEPTRPIQPTKAEPVSPVSESGEPFAEPSQLAQAELLRLYGNTAALLEQVTWTVEGSSQVRIWPHSLEVSVQVRLPQEDKSLPPRFIVMGLAPPGKFDAGGYWYVSPWRTEPDPDPTNWNAPKFGRWKARKGDLPIAILPITEVTSTEDPNEQHTRLATFLADAFNESIRHLAHDADTPGA